MKEHLLIAMILCLIGIIIVLYMTGCTSIDRPPAEVWDVIHEVDTYTYYDLHDMAQREVIVCDSNEDPENFLR